MIDQLIDCMIGYFVSAVGCGPVTAPVNAWSTVTGLRAVVQ